MPVRKDYQISQPSFHLCADIHWFKGATCPQVSCCRMTVHAFCISFKVIVHMGAPCCICFER